MNLPQLYYYRMLGRVGSFSKAAEKLFITQPALSIAIKNLEKELGCTLIERKRNTIEFTETGKTVYVSVSQALQILDDCFEGVKQQQASEANNLHIGIVFPPKTVFGLLSCENSLPRKVFAHKLS